MSVCRAANVFCAGAILHSQCSRRDHLTSVRTNYVHAQNAVGILLNEELDEALGILVRLCTRIREERELADLVLSAF